MWTPPLRSTPGLLPLPFMFGCRVGRFIDWTNGGRRNTRQQQQQQPGGWAQKKKKKKKKKKIVLSICRWLLCVSASAVGSQSKQNKPSSSRPLLLLLNYSRTRERETRRARGGRWRGRKEGSQKYRTRESAWQMTDRLPLHRRRSRRRRHLAWKWGVARSPGQPTPCAPSTRRLARVVSKQHQNTKLFFIIHQPIHHPVPPSPSTHRNPKWRAQADVSLLLHLRPCICADVLKNLLRRCE